MTELNHETFDIGAAIAGIGFPESEVEVFFDERVGYRFNQTTQELVSAEARGERDRIAELDVERAALREEARDTRYVFTLRGLPEDTRRVCHAQARDKHPMTYTFYSQQPEPSPERNELFEELIWFHSIVKLTDPKGAVGVPTEEHIKQFRQALGKTATKAINSGINELEEGAKAGFEEAIQDVDFLSDASPEG